MKQVWSPMGVLQTDLKLITKELKKIFGPATKVKKIEVGDYPHIVYITVSRRKTPVVVVLKRPIAQSSWRPDKGTWSYDYGVGGEVVVVLKQLPS